MESPERLALVLGLVGIAGLVWVVGSRVDRPGRVQSAARYTYRLWAPWFYPRTAWLFFRPMALWFFGLGLAVALPRLFGAWLAAGLIAAFGALVLASYRVREGDLPAWLREEIARGETRLALPERWDWFVLWVVEAFVAAGVVGIALLIVVFHAAD